MNILFTAEPVIAALAWALFAFAAGPAEAASPLAQLDGSWSGSGRINLTNGKSEGLKCTAYYTPKEGGAEVGVALRCASASNKVDLRAKLVSDGSRVSGSWEAYLQCIRNCDGAGFAGADQARH
jgi:hypothetical protein